MSDDKPIPRRHFFRHGLRELLRPLANGIDNIERITTELGNLDTPAPPRKFSLQPWLRPPGALDEDDFRTTCSRCGVCVSVCPAHAIKLDPSGAKGHGAPYIDAAEMPCVVCDTLACMQGCPSGALLPTPRFDIDMGTALWHEFACLRYHGEQCTICVDQCPLGSAAIVLSDNKIKVIEEGCIGCGVCEHYCPTSPKSITITPRSAPSSSPRRGEAG